MTLRLAFMGTPEFAVPSLAELLANGYDIARVYTQPPRRAGRGKKVTKSAVHQFAEIMGLTVETPESFRKPAVINALEALDVDVACVVAYGQILPRRALAAPRLGCLNLHASLLPRWRGAAPIQRAIMAGDNETGVQIMQMAKGLDTGDILLSETPQSGTPSYAHKIDKSEARLDWTQPAHQLDAHIRGLSPFPGAWCEVNDTRLKLHLAIAEATSNVPGDTSPGTVLETTGLIACGTGALRLLEVQPAGKSKMTAVDFLRGSPLRLGQRLL